ncbi:hypothetical protein [Prauserella flavalba]|uniref:hypothetical protein n=1 Tax=Prauserella flavalba TaxID=1477506 RepID=UPI0036EA6042
MSRPGEFSTHQRAGDHVVKMLDVDHRTGMGIAVAAHRAGARGLRTYLDTLVDAGVALPPGLEVVSENPLAVRHQWVSGPTLADAAADDVDSFVAAVARIGQWLRALESTDARIDTNLANFCLRRGRVVLVDVLPPLVPSTRPEPHDSFDALFGALCFDTPVTLDALVGYAARALLKATTIGTARRFLPLARDLLESPHRPAAHGFPGSWFRARASLALCTLEDEERINELHEFFALTSVLVFRELDEPARIRRIRQVHRRIEERNLL